MLFINDRLIIVLLKHSLAANRVHLPAGRHTSTHSAQNGLRANCPVFITKDQWPPY